MTPQQCALVIRALVGPCSKCGGGGSVEMSAGAYAVYEGHCPHCDGFGATLADATRENWPEEWWDHEGRAHHPVPFVPDFPNNDAASVKLAEVLAKKHSVTFAFGYDGVLVGIGSFWSSDATAGADESVGAALIAALEAQDQG